MPRGVYVRTEYHRKKNSESRIGKKLSEVTKAAMRVSHTGKIVSPELCKKLSDTAKNRPKISEYTRSMMREAAKRNKPIKSALMTRLWSEGKLGLIRSSSQEDRVYLLLIELLGSEIVRQGRIPECGRHPYDFLIPSLKLAIEVDGCYWHGCPIHYPELSNSSHSLRDREINEQTLSTGWKIIRIWEHEVDMMTTGSLRSKLWKKE